MTGWPTRPKPEDVRVVRALSFRIEVRAEHASALADGHVHWDSGRLFCFGTEIVRNCVLQLSTKRTCARRDNDVHHAMTIPIVVYVPLVMQKVAKYRTWLLSSTVSTSTYPIPARALFAATKRPRLCIRSET